MGIPSFSSYFTQVNNRIPDPNRKFITQAIRYDNVTKLFIDFANFINDIIDDNPNLDIPNPSIDEFGNKILERIEQIKVVYPDIQEVYIYYESIPTCAKIPEQYRRGIFKKILSSIKNDLDLRLNVTETEKFNRGLLSIENLFMTQLKNFLTDREIFVKNYLKEDPSTHVGEAEHKIMYDIKQMVEGVSEDQHYVIYSKDADVVVLSSILTNLLTTEARQVTVDTVKLSEIIQGQTIFSHVDSRKFINYLLTVYSQYRNIIISENSIMDEKKLTNRNVNDILYLFNFLGSDFIPSLQNVKIFNDFNIILFSYATLNDYLLNITGGKFTLNNNQLYNFLSSFLELKNIQGEQKDSPIKSIDERFNFSLPNTIKDYRPQDTYRNTVDQKFAENLFDIENVEFATKKCIDQNDRKFFEFEINKWDIYLQENTLNKIIVDFLIEGFKSGYYFYEKKSFFNTNNFYTDNSNTNKLITEISDADILKTITFNTGDKELILYKSKSILLYPHFEKENCYVVKINPKLYCFKKLFNTEYKINFNDIHESQYENILAPEETEDLIITPMQSQSGYRQPRGFYHRKGGGEVIESSIKKYFEGLTFILDLYFNYFGKVNNNFWMNGFNSSLNASDLIRELDRNNKAIPLYTDEFYNNYYRKTNYFNVNQFNSFKNFMTSKSYLNLKKKIYNYFYKNTGAARPEKINFVSKIKTLGEPLDLEHENITYNDILIYYKINKGADEINPIGFLNLLFNCGGQEKFTNNCSVISESIFQPIYFMERLRNGDHILISTEPIIPNSELVTEGFPTNTNFTFLLDNLIPKIIKQNDNTQPLYIDNLPFTQNLYNDLLTQKLKSPSVPDELFILEPELHAYPSLQTAELTDVTHINLSYLERITQPQPQPGRFQTRDSGFQSRDRVVGFQPREPIRPSGSKVDQEVRVAKPGLSVRQDEAVSVSEGSWRRNVLPPQQPQVENTLASSRENGWVMQGRQAPIVQQDLPIRRPVTKTKQKPNNRSQIYRINKSITIDGWNFTSGHEYIVDGNELWVYKRRDNNFINIYKPDAIKNEMIDFVRKNSVNGGLLQSGGNIINNNEDIYKQKYLKYKKKYLELKNKIKNN